jgi:hypothetical protein
MEKLRNIISNLYIYRFQNNNNNNNNNNFYNNINNVSNINPINFSGNDDLADDYEIINNLNTNKKPTNYNNQNKNNLNSNNNILTINNKYSNTLEKPFQSLKSENIDNYNSNNKINNNRLISKEKTKEEILNNNNNHFMIKSGINYVVRNKKLLKEKEWKMREERLKKENEALHLLLSHKPKPNNVRSKLFDYQEKQSKIKKVGNLNNRSHSSNGNKKLINGIKKYNLYYNNENLENNENEIVLNNYDLKYYKNLAGNLVLPKIKPETSPLANIQEKDESILKENINDKNSVDKENNNLDNNQIIKDDFEEKINDIKKTLQQQNKSDKYMTEEEKKEKMNELNLRKKDLEIELFNLPIARLSKRQIERKSEIEKSLDNIDYELNKLSYVKIPLKI